jgi:hypothetical protein
MKLTLWEKQLGYSSLNKKSKLKTTERNLLNLTPRVKSIIIGLLLSDGWLQKRGHWNPRFCLKQSIKKFNFIWTVYNEFSYLCSNLPYLGKSILRGKLIYNVTFQTRQLNCLYEIYEILYEKNKKVIKPILFDYLDYLVLAYWIQGRGHLTKDKRLYLDTYGFTIKEVVLLVNIIIIKFDLNCTLFVTPKKSRIYLNEKDLNKIIPNITPYFVISMLYKLDIKQENSYLILNNKSYLYNLNKNFNQIRRFQTSAIQFKLSKLERDKLTLPQDLIDIIIGLTMGDLCIYKRTKNSNPYLMFEQGFINKEYIFHLYALFKVYCKSEPKILERKPDFRKGKVYTRLTFYSYILPCFNKFYLLFYSTGKKIIPLNIGELLTARGLAYWSMDDGNKIENGFFLNTQSYTKDENLMLINVLKEKFNLDCTLIKHRKEINQTRIYIRAKSMPDFIALVNPYFHNSMMYKLNRNDKKK